MLGDLYPDAIAIYKLLKINTAYKLYINIYIYIYIYKFIYKVRNNNGYITTISKILYAL